MTDYRVPTVPLQVELHCDDGRRLVGDVFLPAHSSRYQGAMTPQEWINTVSAFFPFRPFDGHTRTVLNRRTVVVVSVASPDAADEDEAVDLPSRMVEIEAGGEQFRGQVVLDMPTNQRRVVDLLNGPDPFLLLRVAGRHHLIQKAHITRVYEFPEN
jgi:hypothetical protein